MNECTTHLLGLGAQARGLVDAGAPEGEEARLEAREHEREAADDGEDRGEARPRGQPVGRLVVVVEQERLRGEAEGAVAVHISVVGVGRGVCFGLCV